MTVRGARAGCGSRRHALEKMCGVRGAARGTCFFCLLLYCGARYCGLPQGACVFCLPVPCCPGHRGTMAWPGEARGAEAQPDVRTSTRPPLTNTCWCVQTYQHVSAPHLAAEHRVVAPLDDSAITSRLRLVETLNCTGHCNAWSCNGPERVIHAVSQDHAGVTWHPSLPP